MYDDRYVENKWRRKDVRLAEVLQVLCVGSIQGAGYTCLGRSTCNPRGQENLVSWLNTEKRPVNGPLLLESKTSRLSMHHR